MAISAKVLVPLLVLVYASLRMVGLDQLVTTDEPLWLGRSANFYRALISGDLDETYQMAHPGILTMWAGSLAYAARLPDYATLVPFNLDTPMDIEWVLRDLGVDPLAMMVTARISKIVVQSIFFGCALMYCMRLFNRWVALAAGILIACDPFLSGLDTALHVDGLFAMVCFAALLSLVYAAEQTSLADGQLTAPWAWAIAGALCACAWLTRATGIVLTGMVGLVLAMLIVREVRNTLPRADLALVLLGASKHGWIWLASSSVVTLALLPALWIAPVDVGLEFIAWNAQAAIGGHENPTYFLGTSHNGDAGPLFYPLALLWRTTPATWLGVLLLAGFGVWAWRTHRLSAKMARTLVIMLIFAAIYMVLMSIGAKKFDRYVLPAVPILDLYAALGFWLALCWMQSRLPKMSHFLPAVLLTLLVVGQAQATLGVLPYRLDYYNPVLGGTVGARDVFQLGWGQGGREVVTYLKQHAHPSTLTSVSVSGAPQAFTYFLPEETLIRVEDNEPTTASAWCATDWYVAAIQQTQRDLAPTYHWLERFEPAHVVTIEGVPYFEVYDLRVLPPPAEMNLNDGCP